MLLSRFWGFVLKYVVGKDQLGRHLTNHSDHGIILLVPTCELLAEHLLELDLIKRFSILRGMNLGQVGIVGCGLGDKSNLFFSELPQKFCRIASPYLIL